MKLKLNNIKVLIIPLLISLLFFSLQFFFHSFLARNLAANLYGDVSLTLKLITMFSMILLMGTNISCKRFLSPVVDDNEDSIEYIQWNLGFVKSFFKQFLILLLFMIIAMILLTLFGYHGFDDYHMAFYLLWLSTILAISILVGAFLFSFGKIYLSGILNQLIYPIFIIIFMIILVLDIPFTTATIIFTFILSYAVLFAISITIAKFSLPSIGHINLFKKRKRNDLWEKSSYKIALNNGIYTVICALDLIILELFSSNENDVGYYSSCIIILSLMHIISPSIFMYVKPLLSKQYHSNNRLFLQKIWNLSILVNTFIISISLLLFIYYGRDLLLYFGKLYVSAYDPLIILLIGAAISCIIAFPCSTLIVLVSDPKLLIYTNVTEIILLLIFGVIFTILWGMIGIAIATSGAMIIKSILMYIICNKQISLKPLAVL